VAHQNLVYGLEPQARGRLNALLFTGVFIGMSLGSVLGSKLYVLAGWSGVVTLAVVTGAIALGSACWKAPVVSRSEPPDRAPS
jgi:predicted MFS family arabinose efflux permease